jgi:hypothetical protein
VDELLGLVLLAAYITGIVGLAAAITYAVIKIFPTERRSSKPDKPEAASADGAAEASGSLFRRSKKKKSS